jgi:hypothetical protein
MTRADWISLIEAVLFGLVSFALGWLTSEVTR